MEKEKILIVDDSEMNRSILADMLADYEIIEAEDGVEAVEILSRRLPELSLMLLDIVMPRLDGFGVLEKMKERDWIEKLPVIIISAENGSNHVERAYELGATDFIARPFDSLIVQRRVVNTLLLYAKQKRLIRIAEEQVREKERYNDLMIDILSQLVEFRNGESGLHIKHVRRLTQLFLTRLEARTDAYPLTEGEISLICTASALHDIGKIAIDDKILNKPGRLTPEEYEIMKTHSALGADMLRKIVEHQNEPLIQKAAEICRWHHERWDGGGYPDGLRGDAIPISAQVVALADVYDALTSKRVYKPAYSHEQAVRMILGGECGAFNPLLLECISENDPQLQNARWDESIDQPGKTRSRAILEELHDESGASRRTLSLLEKERMKNSVLASMAETVQFEYTPDPPMITMSPWGAQKLGLPEIIMDPKNSDELFRVLDREYWEEMSRFMRASTPEDSEKRIDCPLHYGGETRWARILLRTIWTDDEDPVLESVMGTVLDIHDSRVRIEELARRSTQDSLTGLLNRASARERIERRMAEKPEDHFALCEIDIDDFKKLNDTFGHMFGDQVLRELSRRMKHSVRSSDICCRAGGEEFFLFLDYNDQIESTVDRIYKSLCFEIEGLNITVSMGVALSVTEGPDYTRLYRAADLALYKVKKSGKKHYRFYEQAMSDALEDVAGEEGR